MAGLIIPVVIAPDAPAAAGKKGAAGSSGDFVAHVRRAFAAGGHGNKLGVAADKKAVNPEKELEKIAAIKDPIEAMAAFLAFLKEMAASDTTAPGGGWQAKVSPELLTSLATTAGFDDNELATLFALDDNGTASMSQILDLFSRHFADLAGGTKVTLPETDLPLLNAMMDQSGVDAGDIAALEKVSLGGDGKINLAAFVAGLQEIVAGRKDPAKDAEFSFWEIRGLRDLMARAGWAINDQDKVGTPIPGGDKVSLGLADLANLLQKALNNAVAQVKGPDLPAFSESLKNLLSDSGFSIPADNFISVTVKSRGEALNQLLQTVDLSTVKVRKMTAPPAPVVDLKSEAQAEAGREKTPAEEATEIGPAVKADEAVIITRAITPSLRKGGLDFSGRGHESQVSLNIQPPPIAENIVAAPPAAAARPPLPVDPQQVLNQLTSSIAKGIAERQHHIQIRLQPPELGEIKVDLLIKHDQVAVSFLIQDSRVRDILEANMQQFRDQLAGRGFTLAGLDVSVGGGDDDPSGKWREVFAASGSRSGGGLPMAGLSEVMAPYLPARMSPGDQGINIMV